MNIIELRKLKAIVQENTIKSPFNQFFKNPKKPKHTQLKTVYPVPNILWNTAAYLMWLQAIHFGYGVSDIWGSWNSKPFYVISTQFNLFM